MFKRLSLLLLLSAAVLLPIGVSAIGLGEIRLHSALDQPFSAEIVLISVAVEEIEEISVRLAPPDQFKRIGIELTAVLQKLKFTPSLDATGRPVVKVTSRDSVKEPFLNFLVEVSWPAGRVLREYTVLLDPPVLMRGAPPMSQAPAVSKPAAERPPAVSAPPKAAPGGILGGGAYGPVQRGETLWVIAERVRPDASLSIEQVMISLQRANPEAFLRNNINGLKAGVLLRVPNRDEIVGIGEREARSASSEQYAEWTAYRERRAMQAGQAPRTAAPLQAMKADEPEASDEARIKLVVPESGETQAKTTGPEGSGSGATATMVELEQQLAIASEESEARRLQNEELSSQVQLLEEQIGSLKKLLSLNVDELAALEASLRQADTGEQAMVAGEQGMAAGEQGMVAGEQAMAAGEQGMAAGEQAMAAGEQGMAAGEQAMAAAEHGMAAGEQTMPEADKAHPGHSAGEDEHGQPPASAAPVAQAVAPPPPPPETTLTDMLADPWVLGGGAAVIVFVLVMLMRKRGQPDEAPAPVAEERAPTVAPEPEPAAKAPSSAATDSVLEDFAPAEAVSGDTAPAGSEDPLGEADVYLAYGRIEQAEELLRNALNSEPGRADYMLKLLEIYHSNKDRGSFERQLEELYEVVAGEPGVQWERALELGRTIAPDNHLVAAVGDAAGAPLELAAELDAAVAASEAEFDDDLDIDLDFEPVFGDEEAPAEEQPLDITQEIDDAALIGAAVATEPATTEASDEVDFDLDFGDLAEPEGDGEGADLAVSLDEQTSSEESPAGPEDLNLEFDIEAESTGVGDELTAGDLADLDLDFEGSDETGTEAAAPAADTGIGEEITFDLGDELPDLDLGEEMGDEGLEGEAGGGEDDMVSTKLELAQAYLDMEDFEGARGILEEVLDEGGDAQKQQAQKLLDRIPDA